MPEESDRHLEAILDQAGADAQPREPSWDGMRDRIAAIPQVRRLVLLRPLATILGVAAMIAAVIGIVSYLAVGPAAVASGEPVRVVRKDIEITVFNETQQRNTLYMPSVRGNGSPNGTILVKDHRIVLNLRKGDNIVRFTDVAATIDPTSVRFTSQTDPTGTLVVEQNFEYDLATAGALLKRYVDKKISCISKDGKQYEGYLCSHDDANVVLADRPPPRDGSDRKTETVARDSLRAISLPDVPKDLFVKPTLVWKLRAQKPGQHDTTLTYLCGQAKWNADYIAAVTPGTMEQGDRLDLQGWVTIDNRSGSTYRDAGIKLIAGDVNRVEDPWAVRKQDFRARLGGVSDLALYRFSLDDAMLAPKKFVEKSFFEYHLYTLSAPSTVKDRQIKQLKLLKAEDIKALRRYVFDPVPGRQEGQQHVNVRLEFKNEKENNLGMPLPKGKIRVMQRDADGEMQLISAREIDHTSKDEEIKLAIGEAFDVMAERAEMKLEQPVERYEIRTVRLRMRNHKDEPIQARFVERLVPNRNWSITLTTDPWTREDVNTIHFDFVLPPNAEKTITYTVDYQW